MAPWSPPAIKRKSPSPPDETLIPCEFCSEPIALLKLISHQVNLQKRESGPSWQPAFPPSLPNFLCRRIAQRTKTLSTSIPNCRLRTLLKLGRRSSRTPSPRQRTNASPMRIMMMKMREWREIQIPRKTPRSPSSSTSTSRRRCRPRPGPRSGEHARRGGLTTTAAASSASIWGARARGTTRVTTARVREWWRSRARKRKITIS